MNTEFIPLKLKLSDGVVKEGDSMYRIHKGRIDDKIKGFIRATDVYVYTFLVEDENERKDWNENHVYPDEEQFSPYFKFKQNAEDWWRLNEPKFSRTDIKCLFHDVLSGVLNRCQMSDIDKEKVAVEIMYYREIYFNTFNI